MTQLSLQSHIATKAHISPNISSLRKDDLELRDLLGRNLFTAFRLFRPILDVRSMYQMREENCLRKDDFIHFFILVTTFK